jgi:hypothetical protein
MFRAFAALAVLALTLAAAAPPAPVPSPGNAPGDRYFGKLKMSGLGIRYSIQHLRNELERHERSQDDTFAKLKFSEDALFDWAARYPKDSWLAQTAFAMAKLDEEIATPASLSAARRIYIFIRDTFAKTTYVKYATQSVAVLRSGLATPRPTPVPTPVPTPSLSPAPSPSPATTEPACHPELVEGPPASSSRTSDELLQRILDDRSACASSPPSPAPRGS